MGYVYLQPPRTEVNTVDSAQKAHTAMAIAGIVYVIMLIGAELSSIFWGILPAVIIDGVLLLAITNFSYFIKNTEFRRESASLSLLPLLRILSIVIPIPQIAPILWYAIIGFPLLATSVLIIAVERSPILSIHLFGGKWITQILFGLIGIPIGFIAIRVLPATMIIIPHPTFLWILVGAVILTIFSGLTEEIIYRGFIQNTFYNVYGSLGILISSMLYATMFLGTLTPATIIFFGLTGLLFSIWAKYTNSLWGVIIAHSLLNIVFLLLAHII